MAEVVAGRPWILAGVQQDGVRRRFGMAMNPGGGEVLASPPPEGGAGQPAEACARLLLSQDVAEAALGLATVNALVTPPPAELVELDAIDWLLPRAERSAVAVVGRFPFIEEDLRSVARHLWVFEQRPRPGEHSTGDMPRLLPRAEVVVITASTLANHTLEPILALLRGQAEVLLAGPSTPLSPILFRYGIDAASGVEVTDSAEVREGLRNGVAFRRLRGLRRVSLVR